MAGGGIGPYDMWLRVGRQRRGASASPLRGLGARTVPAVGEPQRTARQAAWQSVMLGYC